MQYQCLAANYGTGILVMVKTKDHSVPVRILFLFSFLLTVVPDLRSGPYEIRLPLRKENPPGLIPNNEPFPANNPFLFASLIRNKYPNYTFLNPQFSHRPDVPSFYTCHFAAGSTHERGHSDTYKACGILRINGPPPYLYKRYSGDQPLKSKAAVHLADSCNLTPEVLLASAGTNPILFVPSAGTGFRYAATENKLQASSLKLQVASNKLERSGIENRPEPNPAASRTTSNQMHSRAPALVCPGDISTYTDINECSAFMAGELDPEFDESEVATLTWEMDGTVVDASPATGINLIGDYTFPEGATMITYTATGTDGSTATCTFTITISDNQVPRLEGLPGNITVAADPGRCSNTVFWMRPVVSDNCTPPHLIRLEGTASPGDEFPVGTTRVVYRAYDAMHNESQPQSFTVTVEDRQPPVLTLPADASVECGQPLPAAWTSLQQLTAAGGSATDNCSVDAATFRLLTETKSSTICPYSLTRVYEIADAAGNKATAAHSIYVTGEEAPQQKSGEIEEGVTLKSGMAGTIYCKSNWQLE